MGVEAKARKEIYERINILITHQSLRLANYFLAKTYDVIKANS